MKVLMYHYVRPHEGLLGCYAHLSLSNFQRQLDHFEGCFGFVDRFSFERWMSGGATPKGVLLTFDDGLADHVQYVLPELRARKLFGLFYIASGPVETNDILDVHKVHLVVGRIGGAAAVRWMEGNYPEILDCGTTNGANRCREADSATKQVKEIFNWQMPAERRGAILDELFNHAFCGNPPHWSEVYLGEKGVRQLIDAGMGVGGHGHSHAILAKVEPAVERREVERSSAFTRALVGTLDWGFCYPHGVYGASGTGADCFVARAGWPFAFAIGARDVDLPFSSVARWSLPRHDCNAFPHGSASFGQVGRGGWHNEPQVS